MSDVLPAEPPGPAAAPWRWLALLLLLLGAALRVHDVAELSLIGDEIYTMAAGEAARTPPEERTEQQRWEARWAAAATPLPHALDRVAFAHLGLTPAAGRLFPCLLGIVALVLLPWLAARLWGARTGLILLALLALCPRHVEWSRMARYESAAFLFGGLAVLAAAAWVRTRSRGALAAALVAAAAVSASHPTGVLVPLALGTFLVALFVATHGRRRGPALAVSLLIVVTLAAAWAAATGVVEIVWTRFERSAAGHSAARFLAALAYNLGPLLVVAAAWGAVRSIRTRHRLGALVAAAAGVPLATLLTLSPFKDVGPRFYAAAEPAVVLLAALSLSHLAAGRRRPARAAFALVALVVATQLPLVVSDQLDGRRYDYPAAVAELRERASDDALVLADNHGVIDFYLGRPTYELPGTLAELEEWIRDLGVGRAWLVLTRQRGRLVFPDATGLEEWLGAHATRVGRYGRRRPDDALYRYEVELYEVEGLATSAPGR